MDEHPNIPQQPRAGDRRRVPLTVYIGGVERRRIVGEAVFEGDRIEALIDPKGDVMTALIDLVETGVIQTVSIAFNAPPATPRIVPETGQIQWLKNY